jgi:hypothetical protein
MAGHHFRNGGASVRINDWRVLQMEWLVQCGLKGRGWRKRLATFSSDDILAVHSRIRLAVL